MDRRCVDPLPTQKGDVLCLCVLDLCVCLVCVVCVCDPKVAAKRPFLQQCWRTRKVGAFRGTP